MKILRRFFFAAISVGFKGALPLQQHDRLL
jgi:hypothetical protein